MGSSETLHCIALSLSCLLLSTYRFPVITRFREETRVDNAGLPRLLPAPWN